LCGSRKYPYPPHGWSLEIQRGWGSEKLKFLKESMKPIESRISGGVWGRGFKPKKHLWGAYGYFLEQHITG